MSKYSQERIVNVLEAIKGICEEHVVSPKEIPDPELPELPKLPETPNPAQPQDFQGYAASKYNRVKSERDKLIAKVEGERIAAKREATKEGCKGCPLGTENGSCALKRAGKPRDWKIGEPPKPQVWRAL